MAHLKHMHQDMRHVLLTEAEAAPDPSFGIHLRSNNQSHDKEDLRQSKLLADQDRGSIVAYIQSKLQI